MESLSFIQWCLENLNYLTITLLMTIESSFIPFPSEIIMSPAGYKAAAGELNIWLVILFGTIGANIGAIINYKLAVWIGRPLVFKFADSKIGRMCLLSKDKVIKAEDYFRKKGAISTFVGRLLPGIRQLISIPAGLSKMKLSTFILYTTLGAGIWNVILALLGYYMYSIVPKDELMDKVKEYSHEISYVLIGLLAIIIIVLIYKTFNKKKSN